MGRKKGKKKAKKEDEDEPEPWLTSEAKAVLREGIVNGLVPNAMDAAEVYKLCDLFQLYDFFNFKTNLKNLLDLIAREYDRMAADAEAFGHDCWTL